MGLSTPYGSLTNRQTLVANGLLASLFAVGLAVVVLSFSGWIKSAPSSSVICELCRPHGATAGHHVTEVTALGDGYVTAALGLLISSLVVLVLFMTRRWYTRSLLVTTIAAAGIAILTIAAFSVEKATGEAPSTVTYDATTALYILTVLGGAVAVIAGLPLGYRVGQEP